MKKSYVVDPKSCAIASATAFVFFAMSVVMVLIGRMGSALVFFIMGLLFTAPAVKNGKKVNISEDGISCSFFGLGAKRLSWDEVGEVGVCGMKLFGKRREDKVGSRYIYISPRKMTDQERFNMVLKWPPGEGFYLLYSIERLSAVQYRWDHEIVRYNDGNLKIMEKPKN